MHLNGFDWKAVHVNQEKKRNNIEKLQYSLTQHLVKSQSTEFVPSIVQATLISCCLNKAPEGDSKVIYFSYQVNRCVCVVWCL